MHPSPSAVADMSTADLVEYRAELSALIAERGSIGYGVRIALIDSVLDGRRALEERRAERDLMVAELRKAQHAYREATTLRERSEAAAHEVTIVRAIRRHDNSN